MEHRLRYTTSCYYSVALLAHAGCSRLGCCCCMSGAAMHSDDATATLTHRASASVPRSRLQLPCTGRYGVECLKCSETCGYQVCIEMERQLHDASLFYTGCAFWLFRLNRLEYLREASLTLGVTGISRYSCSLVIS